MPSDRPPEKTPAEYRSIAQLSKLGISSDFTNYPFAFKMSVDSITMLQATPGKEARAKERLEKFIANIKNTPTYSERYLNERELAQAVEYGVKREDLINSRTEPIIKRLDEIALRLRQVGVEITEENLKSFIKELTDLYDETLMLVRTT